MGLVLQLVETRAGSKAPCIDVLELRRPGDLGDIASLGLTLPEAKRLLASVQQAVVAVQARDHAALRPECAGCGGQCRVKDGDRVRSRRCSAKLRCGCPGLRTVLAAAGVAGPPILEWFHLSMRLQHATQTAEGLPADAPDQQQARAAIVTKVERLHWRAWNGRTRNARFTLKRVRTFLPAFKGEPARKLRRALHAVGRYLPNQSAWLVNYAERHRTGLRIGKSVTEGTANFLVNRRGADLLLQARCAFCNGALGSDFGQLFEPVPSVGRQSAEAA